MSLFRIASIGTLLLLATPSWGGRWVQYEFTGTGFDEHNTFDPDYYRYGAGSFSATFAVELDPAENVALFNNGFNTYYYSSDGSSYNVTHFDPEQWSAQVSGDHLYLYYSDPNDYGGYNWGITLNFSAGSLNGRLPTNFDQLVGGSYGYALSGHYDYEDGAGLITKARASATDYPGGVSLDVEAVPEPASWALMLSGFGLVCAAMRNRPKTARHA